MTILVTGGAGFIGTNFVLDWIREEEEAVVNLDKLTYAGNIGNLASLHGNSQYTFENTDISNSDDVRKLLERHQPRAIVHLAAESHVDRSIHGPAAFIDTNIVGTFRLLNEAQHYWQGLPSNKQESFRFLHVSTDEVYGSLEEDDPPFSEASPFCPNSPYSASKAASDHLVRAYFHTYGLPVLTSNCSNNYGPYQFPEKLIPLIILNAISGQPLPVYGDGLNVRDWLFVGDHCTALRRILADGQPGATYNIGGRCERTNLDVVHTLCNVLDELHPQSSVTPHSELISFVGDRPGHDRRYAVDASKAEQELGWTPTETFNSGIRKTVQWYLDNGDWLDDVSSGRYREWMDTNYGQRVTNQ
jgi:dTDP-glucose 4,6-dehydratase